MNSHLSRVVLAVLLAACAEPPIQWEDAVPVAQDLPEGVQLRLDSNGDLVPRQELPATLPGSPTQCPASVRVARDTSGEWYAAWWATRADSTAEVMVARSDDGSTWNEPMRVDTVDAGRFGCRRPAPSIDAHGGHVHVAYAMAAREGAGIFATHSMDRGALFHTPVAVVYGERIGETAIAARGNLVAIAFEDPNSTVDHIGLAYSSTMAHLFQHRETVSPAAGAARRPRIAIGDGRITVGWTRIAGGAVTHLVRKGRFR